MSHRVLVTLAVCALAMFVVSPPSHARPDAEDRQWWSEVQRGLSRYEYHASENRHGLQAPNRVHGLRTYFDASGIRVHDRTAIGSPTLVNLSLIGLGRGETAGVSPSGRKRAV